MMVSITPKGTLGGSLSVPGDKSISHRAVLLGGLANGDTHITGFLEAQDCLRSVECMRQLGVDIEHVGPGEFVVHGRGLTELTESLEPLECGNSGTTMRLLAGVLAAQPFTSVLAGDASLSQRPMDRVVIPLRQMGATISCEGESCLPPLQITGTQPKPIVYESKIASAQVKSCVLLAGLYADGPTEFVSPAASRDHTERMLRGFGARLSVRDNRVTLLGPAELHAVAVEVPGDFASAAYFIVAAVQSQSGQVSLEKVGLNRTRTGLLEVLRQMGADVRTEDRTLTGGEPQGTLKVRGGDSLEAVDISGELIPRLLDEIPLLAGLATASAGTTRIRDASELRVKESDRLATTASELAKLGARIRELPDGLDVAGPCELTGAEVDAHNDHRLAMALAVAALRAKGTTVIHGAECVDISYPEFFDDLQRLAPDTLIEKQVV